MAILFIIPLFLTVLWLYSETKPDVLRRVVYGLLAPAALFTVTSLTTWHPKEPAMRRMAYSRLEQALMAGDTNAVLSAFAIYRDAPRTGAGYSVAFQMVRALEAAKRPQPK